METKSLQELYQDAIAEGGDLIVWAGGDTDTQLDALRKAFNQSFPEVKLTAKVDISKFHDARIDNQLARGNLEVDIGQLQTLHDFDYCKRLLSIT